jgi:hypothetical protein
MKITLQSKKNTDMQKKKQASEVRACFFVGTLQWVAATKQL